MGIFTCMWLSNTRLVYLLSHPFAICFYFLRQLKKLTGDIFGRSRSTKYLLISFLVFILFILKFQIVDVLHPCWVPTSYFFISTARKTCLIQLMCLFTLESSITVYRTRITLPGIWSKVTLDWQSSFYFFCLPYQQRLKHFIGFSRHKHEW